MTAQTIVEVYRTQEDKANYDFKSVVTISYFGDTAYIQGLSGQFDRKCWREIVDYLESKGIIKFQYYRRGKLKEVWIDSGM